MKPHAVVALLLFQTSCISSTTKGARGDQGAQGVQGVQGSPGPTGVPGTNGVTAVVWKDAVGTKLPGTFVGGFPGVPGYYIDPSGHVWQFTSGGLLSPPTIGPFFSGAVGFATSDCSGTAYALGAAGATSRQAMSFSGTDVRAAPDAVPAFLPDFPTCSQKSSDGLSCVPQPCAPSCTGCSMNPAIPLALFSTSLAGPDFSGYTLPFHPEVP